MIGLMLETDVGKSSIRFGFVLIPEKQCQLCPTERLENKGINFRITKIKILYYDSYEHAHKSVSLYDPIHLRIRLNLF